MHCFLTVIGFCILSHVPANAEISIERNCHSIIPLANASGIDSSPFTFDGRSSLSLHVREVTPVQGRKYISIVHTNFNLKVCSYNIRAEGKSLLGKMLVTRNIDVDWEDNSTMREKALLEKEQRRCNSQKRKIIRKFPSDSLVWDEELDGYVDHGGFVGCELFTRGRILSFEIQDGDITNSFFIVGHRFNHLKDQQ
jgi:hypothetical protein